MTDRCATISPAYERDAEWDAFAASLHGDTFPQSTAYAQVKRTSHVPHRVELRRDGRLVGGMQILTRRIGPSPLGAVGYVAKGPLLGPSSPDLAMRVLEEGIELARRKRIRVLVVQPVTDDPNVEHALRRLGWGPSPTQVATTGTIAVDLKASTDDLLAGMRSGLRRNIRKAERAGVDVRLGRKAELRTFYEMHLETASRNGFNPISWSRLEAEWDELEPQGHFQLFLTEHEGELLSGATTISFGDRSLFRTAGWFRSTASATLRPNDLLHWRIMCWAKDAGYEYYDFGGFDRDIAATLLAGGEPPPEFRNTYSQFKLGYGGAPLVLPRSVWRVIPRPLRPMQGMMKYALETLPAAQRALARRHNA